MPVHKYYFYQIDWQSKKQWEKPKHFEAYIERNSSWKDNKKNIPNITMMAMKGINILNCTRYVSITFAQLFLHIKKNP